MCLNAGGQRRLDAESETLIPTIGGGFDVANSLRGEGFDASEDGTGRGTPLVPVAFQETADCLTSAYGTKWNGNASATNGSLFAFHPTQDPISSSDISHAIGTGGGRGCATAAVAFDTYNQSVNSHTSQTIKSPQGAVQESVGTVLQSMQVRRLTPTECERLQGFPDGYTQIPWRKKPASECPDGPRYKALGNSWAVPVVRWIGRRINERIGNE